VNAFQLGRSVGISAARLVGVNRHVAVGCEARVGKIHRHEPLGSVQRPPEHNLGLRLPTLTLPPKLFDCSREVNSSADGLFTILTGLASLWADEAVRPSTPKRER